MNDNSLLVLILICSFISYIFLFRKKLSINNIPNTQQTTPYTYSQPPIVKSKQDMVVKSTSEENQLLPLWSKDFEPIVTLKERPDTDMRDISLKEWKTNMNDNIERPNIIDYQREYEEGVDGNSYKNISKEFI